MISKFLHISLLPCVFFASACSKHVDSNSAEVQLGSSSEPVVQENWLLGQWVASGHEGFDIHVACKRPDFQWGSHYFYLRSDSDGEPYEELDRVTGYVVDRNLVKVQVQRPSSKEMYIFKDGYMHLEKSADGLVKMIHPKFPQTSVNLLRCKTSPVPYSADVAPTPPKYEGIEPGIVDKPRS
ncbi:MAG TPA: hypothetical protein VGE55_01155 [Limnobacter sp.]|uniref:hypothetical protein n=1 Tax=Limnobacter sp. TaxID=2003368 RepID=UPI002ED816C4